MNQKQLQAYIDNQLSAPERAEFEQALANSPEIQRELESYQSFKSAIKSAGISEPTPNLQPILAKIARPQKTPWLAKLAPALVAGVAIFGIGIAVNRATQDQLNPVVASAKALPPEGHLETKSPQVMKWQGSDPIEGADRIRESFYKPIPTIALNNLDGAEFRAAECGSCWISFHYLYRGDNYSIYGRCETGNLNTGKVKPIDGKQLFVFADAVGWYDKGDMTYTCLGGTPEGRVAVATEAMKTTSKLD